MTQKRNVALFATIMVRCHSNIKCFINNYLRYFQMRRSVAGRKNWRPCHGGSNDLVSRYDRCTTEG